MCDVVSMIKRCKVWNIPRVDGDWAGRKVLFVVYVAKVLWWFKVHYKLAMVGEPQGAMRVALQIWQVVFASQTLPVFCLALRKKAQYVVVSRSPSFPCGVDFPFSMCILCTICISTFKLSMRLQFPIQILELFNEMSQDFNSSQWNLVKVFVLAS